MFALAYYSQAANPFAEQQLYELAAQAAQKNQRLQVTGFLQYRKGYFMQYLEGTSFAVNELMRTIAADNRHQIVRVQNLPEFDQRRFRHWSMRYLTRENFAQINALTMLEHVLRDMKTEIYGEASLAKRVNNLVLHMAKFQHLYPELPL